MNIYKRIFVVSTICFHIVSGNESMAVVLSEIMPYPASTAEWIELYNNNPHSVDISNWEIHDERANCCKFPDSLQSLPPFSYAVIARNLSTLLILSLDSTVSAFVPSHWAALNNDTDRLTLFDASGNSRDILHYGNEMSVSKGRSFERIYKYREANIPPKWGLCAAISGHTAGIVNSLQEATNDERVSIWADPNPFSPDSDGTEDQTDIHFELPCETSRITIEIFNLYGRGIRRLVSNIPAGTTSPIVTWDGKDDSSRHLPIGRYILVIESIDLNSGKTFTGKSTVVIAGQFR
mgnify:CR=1 FL=1